MAGQKTVAGWDPTSEDLYEVALLKCIRDGSLTGAELEKQLEDSPPGIFLKASKFASEEGRISDETMQRLIIDVWVNGGKIPILRDKPVSVAPALAAAMGELASNCAKSST